MREIKFLRTFSLIDDTGRKYIVHEFIELIDGLEGLKTLKTDEGYYVNVRDDYYEILDPGRFLTDGIEGPIVIKK